MPVEGDNDNEYLYTETKDMKLVSDYSGLSFNDVLLLDCITYKRLLKDAFIDMMSKDEAGREYLENCWILKQTNPNRSKLRKAFLGDKDKC